MQVESTNISTSLSRMASGRGRAPGNFNFGVGTEGGGIGPDIPQVGEVERQLF